MNELETPAHLFQRPLYITGSRAQQNDFLQALEGCPKQVHLDLAAVASFLSFGMVGQERTLIREISRRPWMSHVDDKGCVTLETVPPHGNKTGSDEAIARIFYRLLCDEARRVCHGFSEIYILLSGGMDSRIVAGVLSDLYRAGDISAKPIAITWGFPDSRDVVYAGEMAKILGFEWKNIEFGPETVLENIDATARYLGLLHSPEMLHNMQWFDNIPNSALVLAGSFGDSIGRAEFAGLHLLMLPQKKPSDIYGILKKRFFVAACRDLNNDLDAIHSRGGSETKDYARNEYWMQGYRMRGGLCHALTLINRYANIYQMFTAPEVYGFMWSLHPARRDDAIYGALLENHLPQLARVPWPRTNKAMQGETHGARDDLRSQYHEYTKWSSGPLYNELSSRVDPEWFAELGIFDPRSIERINKLVKSSTERVGRLNDVWLWLAGFRSFFGMLESAGKQVNIPEEEENVEVRDRRSLIRQMGVLAASKSPKLNALLKNLRARQRSIELDRLKRESVRLNPPVEILNDTEICQR